jgi:hypothetical protein
MYFIYKRLYKGLEGEEVEGEEVEGRGGGGSWNSGGAGGGGSSGDLTEYSGPVYPGMRFQITARKRTAFKSNDHLGGFLEHTYYSLNSQRSG